MKTAQVTIFTALLSVGVASAQATTAQTFTPVITTGTVAEIEAGGDGTFSFALTNAPAMCTNGNSTNTRGAVVVGVSRVSIDGAKMLYATLVTAYTTGRSITVYVDPTVVTTGYGCTVYALDLDN
ncbi:hypothetical protein [Dyella sp.]|jgi:hypothetical protein|uniref:hypothetical protein n=1 Tax=Dyella sp. TaxID=1869338 RepID=UPI002FD882AD